MVIEMKIGVGQPAAVPGVDAVMIGDWAAEVERVGVGMGQVAVAGNPGRGRHTCSAGLLPIRTSRTAHAMICEKPCAL